MVVLAARGKGRDDRGVQQRPVRIAEDGDVGHAERSGRLAVIAALQRHEATLCAAPAVGPVVERHLEGDLRGRRPVGGEEGVAQRAWRDRGKPLGELDHRRVGEARQHHVLERVELVTQRRVDVGM